LRLVGLGLLVLGVAWSGVALFAALREVGYLKRILRKIVPGGRIRAREDLVRIKNYLSTHVRYDRRRVNDPRPWLRASARETLTTGFGFCGENARAALWLLGLGGVRAHRVYIDATIWKHILLEHRWEGGWKFFDSHGDPATVLPDDAVGRIESTDLAALPNGHEGNAYLCTYRLRPFHAVPGLRRFEQLRLPWLGALVLESPSLLHAGAGLALAGGGALCLALG
jgi:hypothetical protein